MTDHARQQLTEIRSRDELRALAHELKHARHRAGMTQQQVAARMGTAQSNIARLESGRHVPTIRQIQEFARATNTMLSIHLTDLPMKGTSVPRSRQKSFDVLDTILSRRRLIRTGAAASAVAAIGAISA
ncbi:MAG: helix-turn-helix transcriptional regulator, partial [Thermomicrobiales bacterium]